MTEGSIGEWKTVKQRRGEDKRDLKFMSALCSARQSMHGFSKGPGACRLQGSLSESAGAGPHIQADTHS